MLVENELKKLKAFDSFYFKGEDHFEEDYYESISEWKSKGLSDEVIKPPNNSFDKIIFNHTKTVNYTFVMI